MEGNKQMKRVFITAIGGDIGYGIIKSLKSGIQDLYIIGCDIRKYNYSLDLVDEFYISPDFGNEKKWMKFVKNVLRDKNVDYFWPVTESEIKIVDKNRESFSDYTVVINESNVLNIALDKGKTAEFLIKAGILTPPTWRNIHSCDNRYPMIVKETFGCGSHSVCIVNSHEELVDKFNHMDNPIIQKYIGESDEEYTMAVFSDGKVVNSIAFKRTLGFGGMSRFVELAHDSVIEQIAKNISDLFNLRGSINVQLRKVETKYYVFEINPRISSTIGFRLHLGFNDVVWWIDMLEGNKVEQYIAPPQKVYGIRNVEEKLFYE